MLADSLDRRFSVAPMMDWTDRHCRYFHRLIYPNILLYTEMVTTGALLHGDTQRFLQYSEEEHPVALQLGGNDPLDMATCAKLAEDAGFDEVNINVGCPSDRVQNGAFGACLMRQPETVAACVESMTKAVDIPVTVKHRIGVDDMNDYDDMLNFVNIVEEAGCNVFVVHARKAWLKGLSPKENRDVPPLQYDNVYRLKKEKPKLEIIINGGIKTSADSIAHMEHVDGVMIGREIYHNPMAFTEFYKSLYNKEVIDRYDVLEQFMPYMQKQLDQGVFVNKMTKHILGLFHQQKGAKYWRRYISENAHKPGTGTEVVKMALRAVTDV